MMTGMTSPRKLLSICILSYNRPEALQRLLESIDTSYADEIEIVIGEDCSPERDEIRKVVDEYRRQSIYAVHYFENDDNYGYDKNLRLTAKKATGRFVMIMGNDDTFIKGALDPFISWLSAHDETCYVLRRYKTIRTGEPEEDNRYAAGDVFLEAGEKAVAEWFRRSVFISGFTFRRDCFHGYDERVFDGTLLFQLYILSEICLQHPSAYCDIAITNWMTGGIPEFGKSKAERELYQSGSNTVENSIRFLSQVRRMTEGIDRKFRTAITEPVLQSYAKYSYGYLFEHRDDGIRVYRNYAKQIKQIGMGNHIYFYIYYYALLILGTKNCRRGIRLIKKLHGGVTPRL